MTAAQRGGAARAGWAKLLEIASDLASKAVGGGDITADRIWRLARVRIAGYQGIGATLPLEMAFSPTPGITVVHGPNGSGKSSIADAIETALSGKPRPRALDGRGGNEPIWEREHRGRDADEALVDLTLLADGEQLDLHCAIGVGDETTRYGAIHRAGVVEKQINLRDTSWMSAIVGYRPVYSYAAIERQVQVARNLSSSWRDCSHSALASKC